MDTIKNKDYISDLVTTPEDTQRKLHNVELRLAEELGIFYDITPALIRLHQKGRLEHSPLVDEYHELYASFLDDVSKYVEECLQPIYDVIAYSVEPHIHIMVLLPELHSTDFEAICEAEDKITEKFPSAEVSLRAAQGRDPKSILGAKCRLMYRYH